MADGVLSDDDFFALATCGALPGGACQGPTVRWGKRRLTLALLPSEATLSPDLTSLLDRSIDDALAQCQEIAQAAGDAQK